ncbi:MAG: hypothetical protein R3B83_03980 [Nitrospirales bacterium]|nr:hypothetical protein [Nitrospirales bacterium]
MVRAKNSINVAIKNVVGIFVLPPLCCIPQNAQHYNTRPRLSARLTFCLMEEPTHLWAFFLFQLFTFFEPATTLSPGAVAERHAIWRLSHQVLFGKCLHLSRHRHRL